MKKLIVAFVLALTVVAVSHSFAFSGKKVADDSTTSTTFTTMSVPEGGGGRP